MVAVPSAICTDLEPGASLREPCNTHLVDRKSDVASDLLARYREDAINKQIVN